MGKEMLSAEKFQQDTFAALNNPQLRRNFKRAMGGLMEKRQAVFADGEEWQELRELGRSIRANALRKLPELLEQLEANCSKNGSFRSAFARIERPNSLSSCHSSPSAKTACRFSINPPMARLKLRRSCGLFKAAKVSC